MTKSLFKATITLAITGLLFWAGIIIIFWWNNETRTTASFSTEKAATAIYSNDSISIDIRRLIISENNKYPFYTPIYFSDDFFVYLKQEVPSNFIDLIILGKDTVYNKNGCISPISSFPNTILIVQSDKKEIHLNITKKLIKSKPKIPLWKQFSFLPYSD